MDEQALWTERRPDPEFDNRAAAGDELASRLSQYSDQEPLVLGIPPGGLEVARAVAAGLAAELDVIVVRKLGAQTTADLRKLGAQTTADLWIGAVTSDGSRYLNERIIQCVGLPDSVIAAETSRRRTEAAQRKGKSVAVGRRRGCTIAWSSWSTTGPRPAPRCGPRSAPSADSSRHVS